MVVQSGEDKALRRPRYGLPVHKRSCKKDGDQYLTLAFSDRIKGNGFKLKVETWVRYKEVTGCPELSRCPSQAGWGLDSLIQWVVILPTARIGTRWALRSFPDQAIL